MQNSQQILRDIVFRHFLHCTFFKSIYIVKRKINIIFIWETLDFLIRQNWSRGFYQGWVKLHIHVSVGSYFIDCTKRHSSYVQRTELHTNSQLVHRSGLLCKVSHNYTDFCDRLMYNMWKKNYAIILQCSCILIKTWPYWHR